MRLANPSQTNIFYSKTSFIGIFTYRDLATSFIGTFCFSSSHHSLYIVTVSRCFICRSFIMSIFLHTFICISIFIFHHEKPNKFTQFANTLQLMYITITKCQHTTRVMATHHETVGGSGEPLQIPINEVFTFEGRPDKWGFTVIDCTKLFF